MRLTTGDLERLRRQLLGTGASWRDGELACVLIEGLTLASIEASPGLLSLPWPLDHTHEAPAVAARRVLAAMIGGGDDLNLKALHALTDTRKTLTPRLHDISALFGSTSSRTARDKLKTKALPWFFDHLIDYLQRASDHLRASGADTVAGGEDGGRQPLAPLPPQPHYRPELRAPIDPAELAQVLKGRLVQAALDVTDLDEAERLARIAATAGADLIEVGDPLIRRHGIETAVRRIRAAVPEAPLVVEFSSSDWVGRDVELAADNGADLVYVLGLDQPSRIERAVLAAREKRVGLVLAIPPHVDVAIWCGAVASSGVDAISIIRNIDSSESVASTIARMQKVAACATIPLVISGGLSAANLGEVLSEDWSIAIVGAAFIHARRPADAIADVLQMVAPR